MVHDLAEFAGEAETDSEVEGEGAGTPSCRLRVIHGDTFVEEENVVVLPLDATRKPFLPLRS